MVAKQVMKDITILCRPASVPRPASMPADDAMLASIDEYRMKGEKSTPGTRRYISALLLWRKFVMTVEAEAQGNIHVLLTILHTFEEIPDCGEQAQLVRDFIRIEYGGQVSVPVSDDPRHIEKMCQKLSRDASEMSNELFYMHRSASDPRAFDPMSDWVWDK